MNKDIIHITDSIPTPFIIIEEKVLKKNLSKIHEYASYHGFKIRYHVKTHKSLKIAQMQMDSGAVGICVAKAGEAQIMAGLGNIDMTVAYPALGQRRADCLAKLAVKHKIRVAADSKYIMDELSKAAVKYNSIIGIHIMFDAGLHRCGVSEPEQMVRLAKYAASKPGLRYDGVQIYLGHLYGDAALDSMSFEQINSLWNPAYDALFRAGLKPDIVSSGSTPSLFNTHLVNHVNEIRVGTAVLNDYFVLKFDHCRLQDCAARVIATVVSDFVSGQVIIDAGSKALSAKQLLRHENLEMGYIAEYPEARIFRLHEEHGWIDVSRCKKPPRIGQRISIIPVNIALCMNLHNNFYLFCCNNALQEEKIDARGYYV